MQYLVLWSSLLSFLVLVVFSEAGDISRHKINAEYDSYQSDIQNTENESRATTYSSLLTLNVFNVALLVGVVILGLMYLGIPASTIIGRSLGENFSLNDITSENIITVLTDMVDIAIDKYHQINDNTLRNK